MEQNRKAGHLGTAAATGRSAYESKVGVEAVIRSGGKNPQLKGVVHEVLYRDSLTMTPGNLASGTKGVLSKSATAVRDDVLLKQGSKVVGRAQLKDTVSGVSKTVKQAASGKYAGTKLMGTKETVAAYEKAVENLAKNGRVNKVVGFIAGRLNMRVLGRRTSDGRIDFFYKTRGETRVLARILEQMDADKYDGVHPVFISECNNLNAAKLLEHGIHSKWPEAKVRIHPCSGLCSFYAQDQGLIITY